MTNPQDVPGTDRIDSLIGGSPQKAQGDVPPFRPFMEQTGGSSPIGNKTAQMTPLDLAKGNLPPNVPTFDAIQQQAKVAQGTLDTIHSQLSTPHLKLKQSTKYLLKNKLSAAHAHLFAASTKLGVPVNQGDLEEEGQGSSGGGPLQKFLSLVTSGQNQMQSTQDHLQAIAAKGDAMTPADMLLIQVKMNKAQQELEYSSLLLGKAVDDLKMMMNVQL